MKILLIVVDTLRTDHLSCYGYFRKTSPTLDRLADGGVLFEDSFASATATGPGFTTLFTGLAAINHGYYITPWNVPNAKQLDDNIPTMPEIFQQNGYTTAALDNLINFRSHPKHFVRGYEYYINMTRTPKWIHHHVTAGQVNHRLLPWIKHHCDERFFLFVHYWDPHTPYNQPEPYRRLFSHKRDLSDLAIRGAAAGYEYVPGWGKTDEIFHGDEHCSIDLYDGEIWYVDHAIGEVIDVLEQKGVLQDTLVIITSDHGEQLGQHDVYGHAGLHDAVIYIPLIISYPDVLPQGKRVCGFAQHADLLPTILDVAGISTTAKTDGRSLLPLLQGKGLREEIFVETRGQRAIRTNEWKLIVDLREGGKAELYRVSDDPMEVVDLSEEEERGAKELGERLNHWMGSNLQNREDPMFDSEV